MANKLFLYKSIPYRILLLFNIKNIFQELVFLILNALMLISSFVFGIISKFFATQASLVVAFNFFILFYISCLLFILILRMVQFFYHNKIEDKTTFITLSNQVSRTKLFISTWSLIVFICLFNFIVSFCFINIINLMLNGFKVDEVLLRITLAFLVYGIVSSILLVNFIIFLIFIFSLQTTTVICTLLLSLSFIANLPTSFQITKEKNMIINFNKNNEVIPIKLPDLYDSFTLNEYVSKNQIKYNYLSKYVYDKFIDNAYYLNDFILDVESYHKTRLENIWKPLGIIKEEQYTTTRSNLEIKSLPSNDPNLNSDSWKIGDKIEIELNLDDVFINIDELQQLIDIQVDEQNKLILQDLYDFAVYIKQQFTYFQTDNVALFGNFIFVDSQTSKITNLTREVDQAKLQKKDLLSIYNNYLKGTYSSNYFTLTDNTATDFIRTDLNFELMLAVRILENYFIKYTTNYLNATNNTVLENSGDWAEYEKTRKSLKNFSYINVFNGMWANYTTHSGFSYKDFWFLSSSDSKISFDDQKNLFLGYPEFTFKKNEYGRIDPNSFNNYINPLFYILILLIFSIISFIFVIWKFQRIDLK